VCWLFIAGDHVFNPLILGEHLRFFPGWAPVALVCNPSYSGGSDQEDHGSRPAQANSMQDPVLKIPITKQGW
jgi:hypothetical protein